MLEKVQELVEKVEGYVPKSEEELNNFKIKYSGKKGLLNDLFASFKEIPNEQKKEFGASINKLKELIQEKIDTYIDSFEEEEVVSDIDLTKTRRSPAAARKLRRECTGTAISHSRGRARARRRSPPRAGRRGRRRSFLIQRRPSPTTRSLVPRTCGPFHFYPTVPIKYTPTRTASSLMV